MGACALVGAADFNSVEFMRRYNAGEFDAVYAVDGGLVWLSDCGVVPDLVLGDFDSLGYVPDGVPVETHPPMKDFSDMELALERAFADGHCRVVIFGGIGDRLDHTLANLQVFARFSERGVLVEAVADSFAVRMVTGPDEFALPAELEQGVVSVFSMSDCCVGVTERGLLYSLDDVQLTNRESMGLSNELVSKADRAAAGLVEPVVSVQQGTLVVMYPLG